MENTNKGFQFLEKYLMGPMGKISQYRIVRAVMAAGMASIPFTIVGSMFLVLNILPQTRALKNLMFFKCGYPQSKKIVNEAEVFSFINYFYLVIYIITRIFLS